MGSRASKTKARSTLPCECGAKHCCFRDCISNITNYKQMDHMYWSIVFQIEEMLRHCLKQYHADFLTDTIFEFLPQNTHHVKSTILPKRADDKQFSVKEARYNIYIHANISWIFNHGKPVCDRWRKEAQPLNYIKVMIMGAAGVGKTALVQIAINQNYEDDYTPTISDPHYGDICINPPVENMDKGGLVNKRDADRSNEKFVSLDYLDMAGQEDFSMLTDQYIRCGRLFLLCFAINDPASWTHAQELYETIHKVKGYSPEDTQLRHNEKQFAVILVGTKCDLVHYRNVSLEQILTFARNRHIPYLETSAKERINVAFLIRQSIYEYWYQSQTHRLSEMC